MSTAREQLDTLIAQAAAETGMTPDEVVAQLEAARAALNEVYPGGAELMGVAARILSVMWVADLDTPIDLVAGAEALQGLTQEDIDAETFDLVRRTVVVAQAAVELLQAFVDDMPAEKVRS